MNCKLQLLIEIAVHLTLMAKNRKESQLIQLLAASNPIELNSNNRAPIASQTKESRFHDSRGFYSR